MGGTTCVNSSYLGPNTTIILLLHYTEQYYTALLCTIQHCSALHYIALNYTALPCNVPHYTEMHCDAVQCSAVHYDYTGTWPLKSIFQIIVGVIYRCLIIPPWASAFQIGSRWNLNKQDLNMCSCLITNNA